MKEGCLKKCKSESGGKQTVSDNNKTT